MTDKKTDTSQDDRTRSQSSVLTTPTKKVPPPEPPRADAKTAKPASAGVIAPAALVVALIALGLSGVVWQQSRQLEVTQSRLSAQQASTETATGRSASDLQELSSRFQQQGARLEALQGQLAEASTVIQNLDEALRSVTDRGSELVLLNDVDHLVTIAQQQLQLGGNVRNAIVALESAQAQLSRANRPGLASLLQTLNGDLDRLRAASTIDIAAFSAQLEELAVLLTEAPLIMPDGSAAASQADSPAVTREHPAPTVTPETSTDSDAVWWKQAWDTTRGWSRDAWGSLREDLGQFIEVRRVDDAHALLMSPDQATRFRDNLRTRVMTAQLALMMRQSEVWKTETDAVVKAIEQRYDESSPLARKALRLARGMADASIDTRLPTVDNTLHVLATLRAEQARSFGGPEDTASQDSGGNDSAAPEASAEALSEPGNETESPAEQDAPEQEPAAASPGDASHLES